MMQFLSGAKPVTILTKNKVRLCSWNGPLTLMPITTAGMHSSAPQMSTKVKQR
jgi:hypothetical protein